MHTPSIFWINRCLPYPHVQRFISSKHFLAGAWQHCCYRTKYDDNSNQEVYDGLLMTIGLEPHIPENCRVCGQTEAEILPKLSFPHSYSRGHGTKATSAVGALMDHAVIHAVRQTAAVVMGIQPNLDHNTSYCSIGVVNRGNFTATFESIIPQLQMQLYKSSPISLSTTTLQNESNATKRFTSL